MATTSPRKSPRKPTPSRKNQFFQRNPSSNSPTKTKPAPLLKKARAPQRCKQCPDHPLRTSLDCLHSKAYGALRRAISAAGIECPERASATEIQQLLTRRNGGDGGSRPGTTFSQNPSTPVRPAATQAMSSPINLGNRAASLDLFAPSNSETIPSPSVANTSTLTRTVVNHNRVQYTQTIDPALLTPAKESSGSGAIASSSTPPSSTPPRGAALLSTPQTPVLTLAMTPQTPALVDRNAVIKTPYGCISGLGCGTLPWMVPRTHPLPTFLKEESDATARFRWAIPPLLNRLERLCEQTGCWMYFGALTPDGRHKPFIHFTSRRLLDEPNEDLLNDLHCSMARTFSSIQLARRSTYQDLAAKNHDANETIKAKDAENEQLRAEKDALERELKQKQLLLEQLDGIEQGSSNR
ncbi:hypothetical protein GYMLUDRAFT_247951 [Collybiopsis luxurians FD-317 M1]|uniref:Uncharacterized protein n=1 Tax=Collybiopsis luxurians FD-317 M1 TaxID=944289 RepID=A0A0D0C2D6_9AGAR|nr:hypothetical protein GYMLUDRAFT_247951 [Collybiopsis luxurians FD-317 M1]